MASPSSTGENIHSAPHSGPSSETRTGRIDKDKNRGGRYRKVAVSKPPKPFLFGNIGESEIKIRPLGSTSLEESVSHLEMLSAEMEKDPWYRKHFKKAPSRDHTGTLAVHWTHLMYFLETVCRQPSETEQPIKPDSLMSKEVHVSEEMVAYMMGIPRAIMDQRDNIYYHNGCRVHVLGTDVSDGPGRRAILTGSEMEVASVEEYISEAQTLMASGDPFVPMRKPPIPIHHSSGTERRDKHAALIHGVWAVSLREKMVPTNTTDHHWTSVPIASDAKEFTELVEDLIEAENYRINVKEKRYQAKPQKHYHYRLVDGSLTGLFRHELNRPSMSTGALNMALTFFCEYGLLHSARDVLVRAQHLATDDTFNTLLRCAAKNEDTAMFHDILIAMVKRNIRPNRRTWSALVLFFKSAKEKEHVISYAMSKGLINVEQGGPFTLASMADSLRSHLQSGQSVDTFLERFSDPESEGRITSILLFELSRAIIGLRDFASLGRLIDIMEERVYPMDSSIPAHALSVLSEHGDVLTGVELVLRCIYHPFFEMTSHVYRELFHVASKGRCYNLCRVLWRYACISGNVDFNLKQSVFFSLVRHMSFKPADSDDDFWSRSMGKVIAGVDIHRKDFQLPDSVLEYLPREYHEHPLAYLIRSRAQLHDSSDKGQAGKDKRWQLAQDMMWRDIRVGPQYVPVNTLPLMLDAATRIDQEWKGQPRPIGWLTQNAIRVPVKRRRKYG